MVIFFLFSSFIFYLVYLICSLSFLFFFFSFLLLLLVPLDGIKKYLAWPDKINRSGGLPTNLMVNTNHSSQKTIACSKQIMGASKYFPVARPACQVYCSRTQAVHQRGPDQDESRGGSQSETAETRWQAWRHVDGFIFVKKGDCTQDHHRTGNPCFKLAFNVCDYSDRDTVSLQPPLVLPEHRLSRVMTSPVADIIIANRVQTLPLCRWIIYRAARNCIKCVQWVCVCVCECERERECVWVCYYWVWLFVYCYY